MKEFSVGTDIEEISRFEKYEDCKIAGWNKIFTQSEVEYCRSKAKPAQHFAVRFCAKESVIKAVNGLGRGSLMLSDIEIFHNKDHVPQVRVLKDGFEELSFKISLSHSRDNAVASVIAFY